MPPALVGSPVVKGKTVDDLILAEYDQRYCRTAIHLPAGTYVIGQVVVDANAIESAAEVGAAPSYTDVLCLENITVPTDEHYEVACLCRGPALVNLDAVKRTTNETDANLIIRLADLIAQGIRFVRIPALRSTETFV